MPPHVSSYLLVLRIVRPAFERLAELRLRIVRAVERTPERAARRFGIFRALRFVVIRAPLRVAAARDVRFFAVAPLRALDVGALREREETCLGVRDVAREFLASASVRAASVAVANGFQVCFCAFSSRAASLTSYEVSSMMVW